MRSCTNPQHYDSRRSQADAFHFLLGAVHFLCSSRPHFAASAPISATHRDPTHFHCQTRLTTPTPCHTYLAFPRLFHSVRFHSVAPRCNSIARHCRFKARQFLSLPRPDQASPMRSRALPLLRLSLLCRGCAVLFGAKPLPVVANPLTSTARPLPSSRFHCIAHLSHSVAVHFYANPRPLSSTQIRCQSLLCRALPRQCYAQSCFAFAHLCLSMPRPMPFDATPLRVPFAKQS